MAFCLGPSSQWGPYWVLASDQIRVPRELPAWGPSKSGADFLGVDAFADPSSSIHHSCGPALGPVLGPQ